MHPAFGEGEAAGFHSYYQALRNGGDGSFWCDVQREERRAFVVVLIFEALPVPVVEAKEDQLRCIGRRIILFDKLFLGLRVRVVPDDRLDIFV